MYVGYCRQHPRSPGMNAAGRRGRLRETKMPTSSVPALSAKSVSFTRIDPPGATMTIPLAINNSGEVVGYYHNSTGSYGFIEEKGVFISIAPPSATSTLATGINNSGEAIGYYDDGKS